METPSFFRFYLNIILFFCLYLPFLYVWDRNMYAISRYKFNFNRDKSVYTEAYMEITKDNHLLSNKIANNELKADTNKEIYRILHKNYQRYIEKCKVDKRRMEKSTFMLFLTLREREELTRLMMLCKSNEDMKKKLDRDEAFANKVMLLIATIDNCLNKLDVYEKEIRMHLMFKRLSGENYEVINSSLKELNEKTEAAIQELSDMKNSADGFMREVESNDDYKMSMMEMETGSIEKLLKEILNVDVETVGKKVDVEMGLGKKIIN